MSMIMNLTTSVKTIKDVFDHTILPETKGEPSKVNLKLDALPFAQLTEETT